MANSAKPAGQSFRVLARFFLFVLTLATSLPSFSQGSGKAVSLKGTDFFRTTLWSPELFNTKSFTFEFWFNADGPGVLVGESDTADVAFWDVAFAEIFPGGVIKIGAKDIPAVTAGTVSFGTWHHLAVVYNDSTHTISAYLDGTHAVSSSGTRREPSQNGRQAVYPFGRAGPTNLGGGNWFTGKFDEVRIWRIAVDGSQISTYWNRILTTDLPGLMALWHFDTTSGSQSPDSRVAANNPALYVPVASTTPLVVSTAPVVGTVPVISTKTAVVTGNSALLQGTGNPQGAAMSVHFEWGLTTAYGNVTSGRDIGSGLVDINFSETIANLVPGVYHFRAVAASGGSTLLGADQTFTILGPTASTLSAVVVADTAQLRGSSNPRGNPTSIFFEWGATTQYGSATPTNAIGAGSSAISFSQTLSNLAAGTYHYRAVAAFDGGRTEGSDQVFTILLPTVQTRTPTVLPGSVQLEASANPQGFPSSGYFQWGQTTSYGNSTPLKDIGNGTSAVIYSETIANLPPGEYHYRAVLTNAFFEILGGDQSFSVTALAGSAARLFGAEYLRTTTWSHQIFDDEDFTFELWFNATSPGALINEADTADPSLWDYLFAEIMPGGTIRAGVPGVPAFTVGTIDFGTWHHLALVYDGNAKLLSAYLDGQPAGSSVGDRNTPKEIGRTSIYCFGRGGPTNLGEGNFLSGFLDEIRIWRRPLSAQEIASGYNKAFTKTEPDLMGMWHLDEPTSPGSYLSPDASGKGNSAWHVPQTGILLAASTAPLTPDLRPLLVTNSARGITPFFAELAGSVNPQGVDTVAYFEYSRTDAFEQTASRDIGHGNVPIRLTEILGGLELAASYRYRLVASNAYGITRSEISFFNATTWAGYAYRLAQTDYLRTVGNQNINFPNSSITVELWFYPTKAGVLAAETAFSSGYDRSIIEILPSGNIQAGFEGLLPISLGDVTFNQWHHVALRYNHQTQVMDGFVDGNKIGSRAGVRVTAADRGISGNFAFGKSTFTKLGTGENFGGNLDEIRVWNVARSDYDLNQGRVNLLAGDEPGLVLNWRCDGLASDSISDSGPKSNNGTNVGAESVVSTAPLTFGARLLSATEVETQFVVKGGSTYRLEMSLDLSNWTPVSTNTAPASGFVRLPQTIGAGAETKFFRVAAQ